MMPLAAAPRPPSWLVLPRCQPLGAWGFPLLHRQGRGLKGNRCSSRAPARDLRIPNHTDVHPASPESRQKEGGRGLPRTFTPLCRLPGSSVQGPLARPSLLTSQSPETTPPSPQGLTPTFSLSLITMWVRLAPSPGPRFLLWERPGNTGFSHCSKHPFWSWISSRMSLGLWLQEICPDGERGCPGSSRVAGTVWETGDRG